MPQPAEVVAQAERIAALFAGSVKRIEAEQARIAQILETEVRPGPRQRRQIAADGLARLRSTVDGEGRILREGVDAFNADILPGIYARGGMDTGLIGQWQWTPFHREALELIAADTGDAVLAATRFMADDSKRWYRDAQRAYASAAVIEGRTAVEVGRELAKTAPNSFRPDGSPLPPRAVQYADGSYRNVKDYGGMLMRTQTALAYNNGALNGMVDQGVKYVEILDGADCGVTSHDDPQKANRLIMHVGKAYKYPISHPNCRRSFAPRPDVTRRDRGRSLVDDGSAADQAAYERAARAARKGRGTTRPPTTPRPPRPPGGAGGGTTRPPRTPRTPRAAAPSRTPRAPRATPQPEPAKARAPVSDAIEFGDLGVPALEEDLREALQLLDTVHDDGQIPRHLVEKLRANAPENAHISPGEQAIRVKWKQGNGEMFSFWHELGHMIDLFAIGDGFGTHKGEFMAAFRKGTNATDELALHRKWINSRGEGLRPKSRDYAKYAEEDLEVWARAYAQYIADSIPDKRIINEVFAEVSQYKSLAADVQRETDKLIDGLIERGLTRKEVLADGNVKARIKELNGIRATYELRAAAQWDRESWPAVRALVEAVLESEGWLRKKPAAATGEAAA